MDLGLLQSAARSRGAKKLRIGAAMAGVVGVSLLDVVTSRQLRRLAARGEEVAVGRPIRIVKTITVNQPPEEVYRFWRNLENLPRFMSNVEAVRVLDDRRSHWRVKGPAGKTVEWDAEIVDDRENRLIAWQSLENADVSNRGMVWFRRAPGARGTEIRLELEYDPPGGRVGATVAKLFGREPGQQANADLRRFKQVMEVGEVVQSDASLSRRPHPARPPERPVGNGEGGAQ
ncbi:MAG TPA: SRPBCC family protein [Polyangia bacterium]|nr:SRPBCC family protein [Polyangia bacterium]